MYGSKLLELVSSFPKNKLENITDFLSSPYFNKDVNITKLFNYIAKYIKNPKNKHLEAQKVFEVLFPREEYIKSRMDQLKTALVKQIENYIVHSDLDKKNYENELKRKLILARFYLDQNKENRFRSTYSSIVRTQSDYAYKNEAYYFHEYQLADLQSKALGLKQKREGNNNLDEVNHQLDNYYLTQKLKLICASLNVKTLTNAAFDLDLVDEVLSHVEKTQKHSMSSGYIGIYYQMANFLLKQNTEESTNLAEEQAFDVLKTSFENYSQALHPRDARDFLTYSTNYCIVRVLKGNVNFYEKMFDIYDIGLKKKTIFINGQLMHTDYKNIVTVGLRVGKYDWVENFIEQYKETVGDDYQTDVYNISLAIMLFEKKEYDQITDILTQANFKDIYYRCDARTLLIKAYYELQDFDLLEREIDNFRIFLLRSKLSTRHKKSHHNFNNFVRDLLKIDSYQGDKKIKKLKDKIKKPKELVDVKWLSEKLACLEKSK